MDAADDSQRVAENMASALIRADELVIQIAHSAKQANKFFDEVLFSKAYEVARAAHTGIVRKTGEPYIFHPIGVAQILCQKGYFDTHLLCAALLHDAVEDTPLTYDDVTKKVHPVVTALVEGVTKLDKNTVSRENYAAENLRKIILSTAKDVRIMVLKLADRLHNMQSLEIHRRDKQVRIAKETLDVYAVIAQKLGLYDFKAELEDLALKYLEPDFFEFLERKITATKKERDTNTRELEILVSQKLRQDCKEQFTIQGRAKHFYSIFKKIKLENKLVGQLYDLYGLRIICDSIKGCYELYGLLKKHFEEVPNRFKDYIKEPKVNGYQSLHGNFIIKGFLVEIQIRTKEMDYQAEGGAANHWKYKGTERDKKFEKKLSWLRQFLHWRKSSATERDHLHNLVVDIFKNEIIAVTPKGDPITLKEDATPVDFAYAIHSTVGDFMKAAKVNGSIVPMDYEIQSGDIVEIEISSSPTVNQNWINYAKQTSTVAKIRKSLGIKVDAVSPKVVREKEKERVDMRNYYQTLEQFSHLVKKSQIKIAKCCDPKSTDPIVAFYTRGKKSISVHKFSCPHQYALDQNLKVELEIPTDKLKRSDVIHVVLSDEPGVIVETLNYILQKHIRITKASSIEGKSSVVLEIEIHFKKGGDIQKLVSEISTLPKVLGVKIVE
jgi:GTP diphosphokinase / guanosine-3',5'-bis(diphosphate) 3'-diphosphatase